MSVENQPKAVIGADETIGRMTFFDKKNPLNNLKGVEFPDKQSAYDIHAISAEVEINFADSQQENLKQLYHFSKTSQVVLLLNHATQKKARQNISG